MLVYEGTLTVKRTRTSATNLYQHSHFNEDERTPLCKRDGYEHPKFEYDGVKGYANESTIGYVSVGSTFAAMNDTLTRLTYYSGNGCHLTKDNFVELLPIWAIRFFDQSDWKSKDFYRAASEKGDIYKEDKEFLKACLLYTVLSTNNHCISFTASDGKYYRNELCLGGDTAALRALTKMDLNEDDKQLIRQWTNVMTAAKNTAKFNSDITYGTYQIEKELNTRHKVGKNTVYDYPILNGAIVALKHILKTYHKNYIEPKAFAYGLIA